MPVHIHTCSQRKTEDKTYTHKTHTLTNHSHHNHHYQQHWRSYSCYAPLHKCCTHSMRFCGVVADTRVYCTELLTSKGWVNKLLFWHRTASGPVHDMLHSLTEYLQDPKIEKCWNFLPFLLSMCVCLTNYPVVSKEVLWGLWYTVSKRSYCFGIHAA